MKYLNRPCSTWHLKYGLYYVLRRHHFWKGKHVMPKLPYWANWSMAVDKNIKKKKQNDIQLTKAFAKGRWKEINLKKRHWNFIIKK